MRKRHWALLVLVGIVVLVAGGATVFVYWKQISPTKRLQPTIDETLLTHEESIIGSWKRVPLTDDDDVYGWRQISDSGKMATLYGDAIYRGSYKILDKKTIETSDHFFNAKDKVNLWTFGFLDGRLIMIHKKYGWVEGYQRVPAGTLDP
jgi:hypothetical protein